jgi:hypothetical protein
MSDETVFREVDEALRRDRMNSAWRRYGPYVIGAAIAIVAIVAANEGWNWWQSSNSARSSDQFYAALDLETSGKLADAQKALDKVIAEGTGQYPMLAKFMQAGLLAKDGKPDQALAAYDALATAAGNQRLKELALLLGANLLVDKGDVAGVKQRVQGLMAPDNPLHNSAREALGLAQYKAGDLKGARESFEAVIADPAASNDTRGRLQLYESQLVAQGAAPPADAAAANPADIGASAVEGIAGAVPAPAAPAGTTPAAPAERTPAAPAGTAAPGGNPAPAGVESSQPSTPDSALDLAVPNAPAAGAPAGTAPADTPATPLPSTGLPSVPAESPPATPAPAAAPAETPATDGASSTPAPAADTAAPATGAAPTTGTTGQ